MHLPRNVLFCIEKLENAGFSAYAVGGCVRDALLGLIPHDYDLCTAATPEETCRIFADFPLVKAGEKHGTIGVVLEGQVIEITTFRTEGDYRDSRHPDWVKFVPEIELDLARRDFTVNAMAYSPTRGFADPFGGQADLKRKVLRAVGDPTLRFTEDALRILRGIRFSVRYALTPAAETENAMVSLAPRLQNIATERIFDELCKLLPLVNAADLLRFGPVLAQVIPQLQPAIGFDQRNPHHAYDLYTHIAHVTAAVPPELTLRWAALLHDIGKPRCFSLDEQGLGHFYGHARESALLADQILLQLKAPTALRAQVVQLIDRHMTKIEPERKQIRRWLSRLGPEMLAQLLLLQEADMGSKGTGMPTESDQFAQIRALMAQIEAENACLKIKDLAVNGNDLMQLGYTGPAIGQALQKLLDLVLDEQVENQKESLLNALNER